MEDPCTGTRFTIAFSPSRPPWGCGAMRFSVSPSGSSSFPWLSGQRAGRHPHVVGASHMGGDWRGAGIPVHGRAAGRGRGDAHPAGAGGVAAPVARLRALPGGGQGTADRGGGPARPGHRRGVAGEPGGTIARAVARCQPFSSASASDKRHSSISMHGNRCGAGFLRRYWPGERSICSCAGAAADE